jgi:hypothetical protein
MHGACMCGAVSFEADPTERHSHACHCETCRRWTGSALIAVAVAPDALRLADTAPLTVYRSSDWAERAFCGVCGSTLYYRVTVGPEAGTYYMSLGLFDEPDGFSLASELFIDCKPAGYAFAGERKRTTKADFEAMFAGDGA